MFSVYPYDTFCNPIRCNVMPLYSHGCRGQAVLPLQTEGYILLNPSNAVYRRPAPAFYTITTTTKKPGIAISSETTKNAVVLSIQLPGFDKKKTKIQVFEGKLHISAEPKPGSHGQTFQKTFTLGKVIDINNITAQFSEEDILKVRLGFKKNNSRLIIPVSGGPEIAPSSTKDTTDDVKEEEKKGDEIPAGISAKNTVDDVSLDGSIEECEY